MKTPTRILFVCLGNIVRSPLAENLFRSYVEKEGLAAKYEVDSAGTSAWHTDERPDARMRDVAAKHGFSYDGRARQIHPSDLQHFDRILVMDRENQAEVLEMARNADQEAKIQLLREFDSHAGHETSVPDPYYGGSDGFEKVYRIIDRSVQGLLEALEH